MKRITAILLSAAVFGCATAKRAREIFSENDEPLDHHLFQAEKLGLETDLKFFQTEIAVLKYEPVNVQKKFFCSDRLPHLTYSGVVFPKVRRAVLESPDLLGGFKAPQAVNLVRLYGQTKHCWKYGTERKEKVVKAAEALLAEIGEIPIYNADRNYPENPPGIYWLSMKGK